MVVSLGWHRKVRLSAETTENKQLDKVQNTNLPIQGQQKAVRACDCLV